MVNQFNRQIVLASRPSGEPTKNNFRLDAVEKPTLESNQVLLKSVYLSLDPYMRGRMNDSKSYATSLALNEVMVGSVVAQVESSDLSGFDVGDWVLSANAGWQDYSVSDGTELVNLGKNPKNPSYALGVLGMPGFTAYMGLIDIGKPQKNETVVVAAATGAVGSLVGQIAKQLGCRVVGIAGGGAKCSYAKEILNFDECIDHKEDDFAQKLEKACFDGIDVYFENVGGKVFDAVLPLLNVKARIPVCGMISQYNATSLPEGSDRLGLLMSQILIKSITVKGFIIFRDYQDRYQEFVNSDMSRWVNDGVIKYKEHLVDGLENTPEAFIGLLKGENFGKLVVQVNQPS